ncbi:hypothetical protein SAMN05216421_1171 [Halopseudomonas xinjiangensis]|uniref:Uncharacterized protein n=1 Tax=Halopseudomonas xinjiangensis TaxID=487184 RepID=A0A1H1QMG7_9GAMM|nr:hypothetical protein [Halopseudomonas xinjiangensis]SDS24537.1 hypothetical protein SAMN05216421_1171 [Halopseudomonas xinjiangensis]
MHKTPLLGALLVASSLAHGQQAPTEDDGSDLPEWTVEKIDPWHDNVSRWVTNTSRSIDGFFGTDDYRAVNNESYLRLTQEFEYMQREGFDSDTGIRFKLDLPTTKERLRLIIESDPEETRGTLADAPAERILRDRNVSSSSIIGLSQFGGNDKTLAWETRAGAGVKFRFPLDPYVRLTAERLWGLGEGPWQLESYNRASWFNSDGYSVRTRWDFGRPLDEARHLRFISNVQWREEYDTLEFAQSVELNRILSERSALRYAAAAVGTSFSRPRMNDYVVLAQYRRDLHKDIIFVDVVPELRFTREHDFDPRVGITLQFEMYFRGEVTNRRRTSAGLDNLGSSVARDIALAGRRAGPQGVVARGPALQESDYPAHH